jgi:hypothetical protein
LDEPIFFVALGMVAMAILVYVLRNRLNRIDLLPAPRRHELEVGATEAERLAHLLVAEIRLYNEQEVASVARHGTAPSAELLEDVARAREMYSERAEAADRFEPFERSVLKVLANGDRKVCERLLGRG